MELIIFFIFVLSIQNLNAESSSNAYSGPCPEYILNLVFGEPPESSTINTTMSIGQFENEKLHGNIPLQPIIIEENGNANYPAIPIPAGAIGIPTLMWDSGSVTIDVPQYANGTVPTSKIQITGYRNDIYPGNITKNTVVGGLSTQLTEG